MCNDQLDLRPMNTARGRSYCLIVLTVSSGSFLSADCVAPLMMIGSNAQGKSSGVNFAVPVDTVMKLVPSMIVRGEARA